MSIITGFDPFKVLKVAMKSGADFADIFIEDNENSSIVCEDKKIEKVVAGRDRGVGIRVIANLKTYYAYTNDTSESSMMELARTVAAGVRSGKEGTCLGLMKKEFAKGFDIKIVPSTVSLVDKAALVKRADDAAWAMDKRVIQSRVMYGDGVRSIGVVNSLGEWIEEKRTGALFVCHVVTKEGDVVQTGYEPVGGAIGLEMLEDNPPEAIARAAVKRGIMMLGARRAQGGHMPVVLSSSAGGTMIHEAIGHGLEADLAMQNLSVYADKVGSQVASSMITVLDDPTIPFKRGSFFFDDEGTKAQKTVLVKDGVLLGYMHDRLSAMKAGAKPTGNGRRESYHHRPIPRMTNTMIAPGTALPDDVIKSLSKGLLVTKMGGGQVNTVNGDFVFEVTEGFMIESGKVGEPVRGATLTGNGPDILMKIDMVGSDLGFGIGTCGKDGQGVPVADAQPTLRIPEIVVGGEAG